MHRTFVCCCDVLALKYLMQRLQMSQGKYAGNVVRMNPGLQKISYAALLSFYHKFVIPIVFVYGACQSNRLDLPFSLMNSLN